MKITPPTLDGENPYQDELTQLRIDRLGQRLTLLGILLPVAVVVILALGYLDLKQRVVGLQDSGAATVQTLSDDLMSRFSTLSVRVAEMETHLEAAAADAAALRTEQTDRLAKFEARIKGLEAEKTGAQQLKAATEALAQQVASLTERLDGQEAAFKAAAESRQAEMQAMAASVEAAKADLAALVNAVEPVKKAQAVLEGEVKRLAAALETDRQAAQQALERQKAASARQLQQALQPMEGRLETLGRKLEQIQSDLAALKAPARRPAPPAPPRAPSPAPASPDLEPGQIIEKPLQ